jgi:dethiobiotin synthetase
VRAPLIVVTGTGTGIGKTHVAEAIVRAWGALGRVAGIKPIETGVTDGEEGADAQRLREASTFHVKPWPAAPYRFARPVSPHLAARDVDVQIDSTPIAAFVNRFRDQADGVVVELAGGLFSPLRRGVSNANVALALQADAVVLVAPDRLGVLHDVGAVTLAAAALGLPLSGVILSAPDLADASTGTNAAELSLVTEVPVVASLPRASVEELSRDPALNQLVRSWAPSRPRGG